MQTNKILIRRRRHIWFYKPVKFRVNFAMHDFNNRNNQSIVFFQAMMNPPPPRNNAGEKLFFKIVQTHEGGKPCLCLVPPAWEVENRLFWPKKINQIDFKKAVEDLLSRPQPGSGWLEVPCKLKRDNIEDIISGAREIAKMMGESDTSAPSSSETGDDDNIGTKALLRRTRRAKLKNVENKGQYTDIMVIIYAILIRSIDFL